MARFSEDFKKSTAKKMLLPEGPGLAEIAKDTGISGATLYSRVRKLREDVEMMTWEKSSNPSKKMRADLEGTEIHRPAGDAGVSSAGGRELRGGGECVFP